MSGKEELEYPLSKRVDVIDSRVGRLEDRYLDLALQVTALNTKMNILGIIGTLTFGSTLTVLIAILTGVRL